MAHDTQRRVRFLKARNDHHVCEILDNRYVKCVRAVHGYSGIQKYKGQLVSSDVIT